MAATVQIVEKNGTMGTTTQKDGGTVRFKNADDANADANNPLIIPSSNREYSYEKWLRMNVTVAPSSSITNVECYSDGAKGWQAAVKLWYWVDSTYSTPVIPTETNDPPQHDASSGTDFFTKTSGSTVDLGSGPYTGTGEKGDMVVLCMEVETTATQGALGTEQFTLEWDEV